MQMKIHGSFINRLGDTVAVEITTRTGGAADMEIGTEEAGLWFDAEAPVAIRAEANGTDDVLLRHSCTIRLLSRSFVPSLFCASCLDAVAMVSSNGRPVFAGYIEPMAYSQPFAEALDTLEINCIDALSALQYFRYGGAGSPDVSFEALKRAARQRSFAHVIKAAIGGVAAGLGGGVRLLYDGSRAMGYDTGAGVLSRLAVSELLFLGDTEDDAWGMDEVVSETLRYLDLHIVQQGTDFLIFSWQTLKAGGGERTIAWHDLGGGPPHPRHHRHHGVGHVGAGEHRRGVQPGAAHVQDHRRRARGGEPPRQQGDGPRIPPPPEVHDHLQERWRGLDGARGLPRHAHGQGH